MAQEQLVRTYRQADMARVYDQDSRELARKGWHIADRHGEHGATTVIYRRESVGAPTPPPLPTALESLAPEVRRYSQGQVLALVVADVLALTVWLAGGHAPFTWIAALIFVLTSIYALVIDAYGVASLRGQIPWLRLSRSMRRLLGVLAVATAPVYMAYYAARVAQLEARLGIMPATVGTCRKCGRPLQVGAEFCSYCGETVIEYPRICPKCATVCLPDAQYCPKCRTPLTA